MGLLIGQQLARQSIAIYNKAIRGMQNDPTRLKQELLFHSSADIKGLMEDKKINSTRGSTNKGTKNIFNNRQIHK